MQRAELAAILSDLVRRNAITLAEARATLARFDSTSSSTDRSASLSSWPLAEATDNNEQSNFGRWTIAYLLVLLLLNGHTLQQPLSQAQRTRARKELRVRFEGSMDALAAGVTNGRLSISQWQLDMQKALGAYTRQMAVAGAGVLVSAQTQIQIDARLKTQWPYLRSFATQIVARQIGDGSTGSPAREMSEQWIAARSKKYGGTGWASYFIGQGSEALAGVVDEWVTKDDPHVCVRCAPRNGVFFLPGVGPWPGADCLGDCRCLRVPVYAPDIYAKLVGSRANVGQRARVV